jgi:glycosyltransferase involved in cell wall biosynthesis
MRVGYLLPGVSAHADDWAIPVQQRLARELALTDHLTVLALRYPHTRRPYTLEGAQVVPLGWTARARGLARLRLWWDALGTLERLHRAAPFDVLHATWADETGLLAAWAGRRLGVPSVVTAVGGECVALDALGYGLQRGAFSRWIVRQALGADALLAASPFLARQLAALTPRPVTVLPLGVDTAQFSPAAAPPESGLIVSAGSLIKVKGHAVLLRALAQLPEARLALAGDGPERAALESLAESLGVAERVQFLGAVGYPDMPALFRRAAVHALPSLHEGQGMVTLEAAACGVPTVGAAVGLLADDAALGVAAPPGDDAALAQALGALLHDEDSRRRLGQQALARARQAYSIEETARRLREVYANVSALWIK